MMKQINAQTDRDYQDWLAAVSTSVTDVTINSQRLFRWYLSGMDTNTAARRLQLSR